MCQVLARYSLAHRADSLTVTGEGDGVVPARRPDTGGADHNVRPGLTQRCGQTDRIAEVPHDRLDAPLPQCARRPRRSGKADPSLVRKLMVPLVQDAFVASVKGRSGGVRLGRSADQITLGEIYRSSIGDKPLWAPRPEGPRECLVTNHSAEYFVRLTDETEAAVLDALAGRTLADSLDELRAIDRAGSAPASERPFPAPRH
jgi:Rrf2 family transcriptional repressor of oqxAB